MRQNWITSLKFLSLFRFDPSVLSFSRFVSFLCDIIYLCYYDEDMYCKFYIILYLPLLNDIIAQTYYERVTPYLWFINLYFNELQNLFLLLTCCFINFQLDFMYFRKYSRCLIHLADPTVSPYLCIFDSKAFCAVSFVLKIGNGLQRKGL